MSSSDDFGSGAPRRRKLVLRKIPVAGPLPAVRPPQKSLPFAAEVLSLEAEAAAAITSSPSRGGPATLPRPRAGEDPAHASGAQAQEPAGYAWHRAPPREPPRKEVSLRATVAPVVASSHPSGRPARRSAWTRASKLLAVGGSLAGVAVFAALGIAVGERSARPGAAAASLQAPPPRALETTGAAPVTGGTMTAPTTAQPTPAENMASVVAAEMKPVPIQALPIVHTAPAAPAGASTWKAQAEKPASAQSSAAVGAVFSVQAPGTAESSAQTALKVVESTASSANGAIAPEVPASPPPAVDPLVQAVREDIREEESRSK